MPKSFIVEPLSPQRIDQAYAVVQPLSPATTLDMWRETASGYLAANPQCRGIVCVRMGTGYIRGLFCYDIGSLDKDGRMMTVRHLTAVGLFDADMTMDAMADGIEQLAASFGCAVVNIDLAGYRDHAPGFRRSVVGIFVRSGYELDDDRLFRRFGSGPLVAGLPVIGRA